jgi:hypothetical protein
MILLRSMVALFLFRSASFVHRPSVSSFLSPLFAAAFANTPNPAAGTATANQGFYFHSSSTSLGMSSSSSAGGGNKLVRGEGKAFPSWTFDKPSDTMEWNKFAGERISVQISSDDNFVGKGYDLVIIGVQPPAKAKGAEEAGEEEDDALISPIELTGKAKEIDHAIGGGLSQILTEQAKTFKNGAKLGDSTSIVRVVTLDEATGAPKVNKYALIGLGKNNSTSSSGMKLGSAIASVLTQKETNGVKSCAVLLPLTVEDSEQGKQLFSDMSSAFYSSLYADNRFKGLKMNAMEKAENLTQVTFHVPSSPAAEAAASAGINQGKAIAKGLYLTKDIVNAPHNVLNSLGLANVARRIAKESSGKIKCQILGKKECEDRGMGAFLGVARGSEADPQFIHLTYKPSGKVV